VFDIALSALLAQAATPPPRPPDGTYTYALSSPNGPTIFTSTVIVKTNGSTFDISESAKLPNGSAATTRTTWDAATLLPLHYEVHQDTVNLVATISPTSITFTGAPLSYTAMDGTKYMLVSEGLNAFRMMLPFVMAAHPGESFTVAQINGNKTVQGGSSTATPPPRGPAGDAVTMIAIGDEHIAVWYNPRLHIVDREVATPGDYPMQLVQYKP
jgi:hypothetical protein